MIETLTIKLVHDSRPKDKQWQCTLEIPVDYSLEDLHYVIQAVVNFDNDHLYEFRISKTHSSRTVSYTHLTLPTTPYV